MVTTYSAQTSKYGLVKIPVAKTLAREGGLEGTTRRAFVLGALGLVTSVAAGCATHESKPSVMLNPGMPNTITYLNKKGERETVYNLSGEWLYDASSPSKGAIVDIEQTGNIVKGFWKSNPNKECREGSPWFRGEIKGDSITGIRYLCTSGTDYLSMKVLEEGKKLTLPVLVKGTSTTGQLTRTRKMEKN